jgi:NTE family protein
MAFLSSFRIGQQTVYPEALYERLKSFALLENVGDAALRNLLAEANWFALPGGTLLERGGENNAALFLVVTGSLGVFVSDEQSQRRMVAHIPAGETVGEMSLIAGSSNHSAQLVALRDTELLRISPDGFESLIARPPQGDDESDADAGEAPEGRQSRPLAQVPAQDLRDRAPAGRLVGSAHRPAPDHGPGRHGMPRRRVGCQCQATRPRNGSTGSNRPMTWCFTVAMRPTVLGRNCACARPIASSCWPAPTSPLPLAPLDLPAFKERASGPPELLLLHPDGASAVLPEHFSVRSGLFRAHHHLRAGHQADVARVARFIAGRAVGLVLAGGGARGFAHIGIIKALKEAGVPFDQLGGTSMGAIIAAGLAREWGLEEMRDRMRAVFVDDNPLSDYTLPLIAIVRGKKVSKRLREHFDEGLYRGIAAAVSSRCLPISPPAHPYPSRRQIVAGAARQRGAAGILPPGHPSRPFAGGWRGDEQSAGGCDARTGAWRRPDHRLRHHRRGRSQAQDSRYGERPWWWLLGPAHAGQSLHHSILMRSGTVGSEAQRRIVREQCDYLIEPPMPDIPVARLEEIRPGDQEGYDTARACIEKNGIPQVHGPGMPIVIAT